MLNPEKIWHEHLTDLSTLPVRCSHFTLGNPTVIFQHHEPIILWIHGWFNGKHFLVTEPNKVSDMVFTVAASASNFLCDLLLTATVLVDVSSTLVERHDERLWTLTTDVFSFFLQSDGLNGEFLAYLPGWEPGLGLYIVSSHGAIMFDKFLINNASCSLKTIVTTLMQNKSW